MRGWIAVNLFLIAMILVAAGILLLSFIAVRAMHLDPDLERVLIGFAAIAAVIGCGIFGKLMLATLEKRARAR